ncbi:MAG: hypothetical protein QOF77_1582 [Solirubrobacteraceae bacterium]|nr:hypothetical protein [Solirubrobacteraceae bacterium]
MPDEEGSQTADVPETPLHAYGDGREEDADPGSRGVTGDQGSGDEASYQEGGHDDSDVSGDVPAATGDQSDAPGADTGSGAGAADPDAAADDGGRSDSEDFIDPESPGRADASRPPRGAPPA